MKRAQDNIEAERLQYQLRGSFFLRKLKEFSSIIAEIKNADGTKLQWDGLVELGISKTAWEKICRDSIKPHFVFCHPDIITSAPRIIAYYRLLSVFPQKGVQRLAFGVQELEEGAKLKVDESKAMALARLFNQVMSSLIEQSPKLTLADLHMLGAMNFGTQVNGSWRNEIGKEGSRKVKEILLNYFISLKVVKGIERGGGAKINASEIDKLPIEDIRKIRLENNHSFIFASEPDVSIMNESNQLESAIEIKAGLDPAGALERYGAAKKSFDKALSVNKSAITIYLACCITKEVKKRIKNDRLVRKDFDLIKILIDPKSREKFLEYVKWLSHV